MSDGSTESCAPLRRLAEADYGRVVPMLRQLEMNTLFARAVLEHGAPGRVFVDSAEAPSLVHVIHGYGMSLLFGEPGRCELDDRVLAQVVSRPRADAEWLQVSCDAWAAQLARLCAITPPSSGGALVEEYTRVNFAFSPPIYRARRPHAADASLRITRADRSAFAMPGSVVPRAFWSDVDRFLASGAGFAVVVDDVLGSLAFSSFVTGTQLEIGIETLPPYRGRGLASLACASLVDDCLARDLEPVWACRLENAASFRLAEALGFVPVRRLPYFRLAPFSRPS